MWGNMRRRTSPSRDFDLVNYENMSRREGAIIEMGNISVGREDIRLYFRKSPSAVRLCNSVAKCAKHQHILLSGKNNRRTPDVK